MESLNGLSEHINEMVGDFLAPAMYGNDAFGLTQYIFWMIVAIIVLLLVVFAARKREALVPKGRFLNAVEFIVEFVRNDIVYGTIGRKTGDKHMPFILSLFFFILANNIIGIIPGMRPGTGTIGVTFALACYSFVYFVAVAIKNLGVGGYIKSFAPAGVAGPLAVPPLRQARVSEYILQKIGESGVRGRIAVIRDLDDRSAVRPFERELLERTELCGHHFRACFRPFGGGHLQQALIVRTYHAFGICKSF